MIRVLFLLLVCATAAEARVKLLLFAPGTTALEAMTEIGFNLPAFFRAQPRCAFDVPEYPCRRKPVDGQFLGHGTPDGNGNCLLPTMYVFAGRKEFSVSITINADCNMRFHNFGPTLSFLDDPRDYQPALSFPDPDGENPGIYPQPLVTVGQQITRRAWVKARTKKYIPPYESPTRDLALVDYREKIYLKSINPVIDWVRYDNFAKVNLNYPWERTGYQPLPGNPAPFGPFTNANTTVATFRNRNTGATHTLIAQVKVGPKAAFSAGCQNSGSFPTDSAILCEQRFSVLDGPRPL